MAIKVVPYEQEHEPLVREFNARMAAGGTDWGFYETATPNWLARGASPYARRDYYVALDDGVVRAAYCLKPEEFLLRGEPIEMASIQGPVSEGLVDARYGTLAFQLIRDMEDRCANVFGWGASDRVLDLLLRLRWREFRMPFLLRVVRGGRFLRKNGYLRRSSRNRLILDTLAVTGAGSVGAWVVQTGLALSAAAGWTAAGKAVEEPRFGSWADEIWEAAKPHYQLIARRDAETMNARLPVQGWPEATILRIEERGVTVGWAAVRDTQFTQDGRFGDLRVGTVIDALAKPGSEAAVVKAAARVLERRGVDAIVSNFTHPVWLAAFKASGFLASQSRRPLLLSPTTEDLIGDDAVITQGLHLTPLDGDGPRSL